MTRTLWASLNFTVQGIIRNIAAYGALVETTLPTFVKSIRAVELCLMDGWPPITAIIRHITPLSDAPYDDRCLVGLEFVNVTPAVQADIDRLVTEELTGT